MNFAGWLLHVAGWKVDVTVPNRQKCIICVAPHTSNWDFIIGKLTYWAVGRKANFLMKESWFFWPLGYLLKAMGGIPVPRRRGSSLTELLADMMRRRNQMNLAITPEGTRSLTSKWHSGFIHIALAANVPIELGVIDFAKRTVSICDSFFPTGDIDADMCYVKNFYKGAVGKFPNKFSTD